MAREAGSRHGERKGDFLAGKYLLEDCLGVGGMGEVYRATNVSLGRQVAIKLLSPEYVHIEEDVLRFLREARAAAAVRHSNVVDVLDVARDDDGTPFIVQELLAGEDLERHLRARTKRLTYEEALDIMIPVADAVAAAHAQNVVHRDLKPANIFLAHDRNRVTPKVLDFGACLFPTIAERSAKEARMLIGTPHYMAPEQIVSKQDVDARSDVWALGVILYELLVGETPFEAETTNAVLQLVKTREVPSLRERLKDAPRELDELVARCTKRDRLARLSNASAVHESMLRVRERLGGKAPISATEAHAARPKRRDPRRETMSDEIESTTHIVDSSKRALAPERLPPEPAAPAASSRKRPITGLLTLSSPGSEPPPSPDDLDFEIPLPVAPHESKESPSPMAPAQHAIAPPSARAEVIVGKATSLDLDDVDSLAAPITTPASPWTPTSKEVSPRPRRVMAPSSIPPILDPRAFAEAPAPIPPIPPIPPTPAAPLPREETISAPKVDPAPAVMPRPPAAVAPAPSSSRNSKVGTWSSVEIVKFVATIAVPATVGFFVLRALPSVSAPVGRALRGDSTLASGVLAVIALACAVGLSARSLLGEKNRWLYVAAAGEVLFGIVMIIVTFAASEAAELGVPSAIGGLSSVVAPIAPLALGLGAFFRARAAWLQPYGRREGLSFAALASLMFFLTLALSPVGVVRTPPEGPAPTLRG